MLLQWFSVQAQRIIQMPCKCLSLNQPSTDLNMIDKSCSQKKGLYLTFK